MQDKHTRERAFRIENGRIWFSKQTERRVFFFLTLAMLCWGAVEGMRGLF